jgi:hypothetical protein
MVLTTRSAERGTLDMVLARRIFSSHRDDSYLDSEMVSPSAEDRRDILEARQQINALPATQFSATHACSTVRWRSKKAPVRSRARLSCNAIGFSQKMRIAFLTLIALLLSRPAIAKELFAARCEPALTKASFTWEVEERGSELTVRYREPRPTPFARWFSATKTFSATVTGSSADELRSKIVRLPLPLPSPPEVSSDGTIGLRPFDGVTYHFKIATGAECVIDNPSFDLERFPGLERTARLREVMDFLERLKRIAKKENMKPNQASEPITPGGPSSS